ncbi:MAG: SPOR domain-containing protein, partial [Proteobacteria bacterium]|nr:SPOR domain-containing protein [Pseudomonadota bacterium]
RYPDHWTIQIIGVANRQNLNAFIQQQQLTDANHRIVETRVNDAPWWVVIYGHYPDRDAADEARSRLPERLATDAWLRPLSSLTGD